MFVPPTSSRHRRYHIPAASHIPYSIRVNAPRQAFGGACVRSEGWGDITSREITVLWHCTHKTPPTVWGQFVTVREMAPRGQWQAFQTCCSAAVVKTEKFTDVHEHTPNRQLTIEPRPAVQYELNNSTGNGKEVMQMRLNSKISQVACYIIHDASTFHCMCPCNHISSHTV